MSIERIREGLRTIELVTNDDDTWRVRIGDIRALLDRLDAAEAENERLRAERDALLTALETMLIGACAVGVPHAGERQVLQECVNVARDVIDAARKAQA